MERGSVMATAVQLQWLDVPFNLHSVIRATELTYAGVEALAHEGIVRLPINGRHIDGREAVIAILMRRIQGRRAGLSSAALRALARNIRTSGSSDTVYYATFEGVRCADVIDDLVSSLPIPEVVDPNFPYVIGNRGRGWGLPLASWDDLAEQVRNLPEHPHDSFLIVREVRLGVRAGSSLGRMAQLAATGTASFIVEVVDDKRAQLISRTPSPVRSETRHWVGRAKESPYTPADLWGPEQSVSFVRGWLAHGIKPSAPDFHLRTVWESSRT